MATNPSGSEVALLRELLGAGQSNSDQALADYIDSAVELLEEHLRDVDPDAEVPPRVLARAQRLVAAEMFGQDQAPNGVLNQQFDTDDGTASVAVRIGADPLRPAYALLRQWVDPVTFS